MHVRSSMRSVACAVDADTRVLAQVQKLIEKIFAVPDGIGGNRRPMRAGSPLPPLPKGAAITLGSGALDAAQANPMHYKQTDETSKFEQVRCLRACVYVVVGGACCVANCVAHVVSTVC
jgi:hypothetical protein